MVREDSREPRNPSSNPRGGKNRSKGAKKIMSLGGKEVWSNGVPLLGIDFFCHLVFLKCDFKYVISNHNVRYQWQSLVSGIMLMPITNDRYW